MTGMPPLLQQPLLRRAASVVAMLLCAGLIAGAEAGLGMVVRHLDDDSVDAATMDETTGSIGPIGGVMLSDEDRFHIYEGVMRIPDAPVADAKPPELADELPREVAMQDLPLSVIHRIPQVDGHKFVKFDDRILVVAPTTRQVIAMIPRYKLMP
jgi:hypothetical protein